MSVGWAPPLILALATFTTCVFNSLDGVLRIRLVRVDSKVDQRDESDAQSVRRLQADDDIAIAGEHFPG